MARSSQCLLVRATGSGYTYHTGRSDEEESEALEDTEEDDG